MSVFWNTVSYFKVHWQKLDRHFKIQIRFGKAVAMRSVLFLYFEIHRDVSKHKRAKCICISKHRTGFCTSICVLKSYTRYWNVQKSGLKIPTKVLKTHRRVLYKTRLRVFAKGVSYCFWVYFVFLFSGLCFAAMCFVDWFVFWKSSLCFVFWFAFCSSVFCRLLCVS